MKKNNEIDFWLASCFFILIMIGIIMIYSSSAFYARKLTGDHQYFLKKHLLWVFIGLGTMWGAYAFPYKKLQKKTFLLMLASLAVLGYLAFVHRGRWIQFGPFHLQGVDVARFSLIFFFADSLSRKENLMSNFSEGLFPHLVYITLFAGLVVIQPDFSSAVMLVVILITMLFMSPVKVWQLALPLLFLGLLGALVVAISPYKLSRWLTFLHPSADLSGMGYQTYQSLVSFGSGGLNGVGFAESQQKLFFLPEAHTDFIFSIIGEELGLKGTLLIVALFLVIMIRGIRIARRVEDRFTFYLTIGITAHFVWYALINMMVTLSLVPPTGLPLPFISYGGTALVFSCIYAGLLLRISGEIDEQPAVSRQTANLAGHGVYAYHSRSRTRR